MEPKNADSDWERLVDFYYQCVAPATGVVAGIAGLEARVTAEA